MMRSVAQLDVRRSKPTSKTGQTLDSGLAAPANDAARVRFATGPESRRLAWGRILRYNTNEHNTVAGFLRDDTVASYIHRRGQLFP